MCWLGLSSWGPMRRSAAESAGNGYVPRHHSRKKWTPPAVDFGDSPVRIKVHAGDETVEISVEADFEKLPERLRRFAILSVPCHLLSQAMGDTARRAAKPA